MDKKQSSLGIYEIQTAARIQRLYIALKHLGFDKERAIAKIIRDLDSSVITPEFIRMSISGLEV